MALGIHWEWRGFGAVSSSFARRYSALATALDSQTVTDCYVWAPGLAVNIKTREGVGGDLKFKRLEDKKGELEKWREDPAEIFNFPLPRSSWMLLAETLATVGLQLEVYPPEAPDRATALAAVRRAGCRLVRVEKQRSAQLWAGPNGHVQWEWARIARPQPILSIGLENAEDGADVGDAEARIDLEAAIAALELQEEPLRIMNYLDAVAIWSEGACI